MQQNNIWYIGLGALVVLAFGLFMVGYLLKGPAAMTPDTSSETTQATGGGYGTNVQSVSMSAATSTQSSKQAISAKDGMVLTVKDFLHNGETVADTVNPGVYFLAGSIGYCLGDGSCPSGAKSDDFAILFNANDQSFNVTLLREPLGAARAAAEKFLISRLGLYQKALCALHYSVGVTSGVSEVYAGKNLGFSSCSGATPL